MSFFPRYAGTNKFDGGGGGGGEGCSCHADGVPPGSKAFVVVPFPKSLLVLLEFTDGGQDKMR